MTARLMLSLQSTDDDRIYAGYLALGFSYHYHLQNSGVGRIRTSGLQRPRLASYQARQRPLVRRKLSQSECNFNLMNKIDVLPFIYPTIGLWHKQAKLVLLFFQQFES